MKYYSTNGNAPLASLKDAVIKGLAPDGGLYMPERISVIPKAFFNNLEGMTFQEIAYVVANTLFGEDVESDKLKALVYDALNFPIPLKKVEDNIYVLELFHGPTLAFKDVGARFMARLLGYFNEKEHDGKSVNVLVATSGDTGSAVANGFLNVPGVNVFVLYPKGKVSRLQEMQFATLGANIHPLEIDGTFDDCQAMVKAAFVDDELNDRMKLTSANSINPARFLPQMFYYFWAYAQLLKTTGDENVGDKLVFCVPSGNLGNICSALIGNRMGLPVKRFIAANNRNRVFADYLSSGIYSPKASILTVANAMDVGAPSNFARILDLYGKDYDKISAAISGYSFDDKEILDIISTVYREKGYLLDPHGATGYLALKNSLKEGEIGIFLETAHPAKFKETVESSIGQTIEIPETLQKFIARQKQSVKLPATFSALKRYLLSTNL